MKREGKNGRHASIKKDMQLLPHTQSFEYEISMDAATRHAQHTKQNTGHYFLIPI
jgi:hypothetical protein